MFLDLFQVVPVLVHDGYWLVCDLSGLLKLRVA
jgi:hypothetical protein